MFQTVKAAIIDNIIVPIVGLLFVLAWLLFIWGVVRYIWNGNNPEGREKGRQHMFWGIIGIAIMLSAFGLTRFIYNTVTDDGTAQGIDNEPVHRPSVIDGRYR